MNVQPVYVNNQDINTSSVRGHSTMNAVYWHPEGFVSIAPPGSRALRVMMEGDAGGNNAVFMAHRRNGALPTGISSAGEAMMYNAITGSYIYMDSNGTINIVAGSGQINIRDSNVNVMSSNVNVTDGDVVADGVSLKEHTHPQNSGNHFGGGTNTSAPNQ